MQGEPFQNDIFRETSGQNWLIVSFIALAVAYIIIRIIYHRYWRRYRQALFLNLEAVKLLQEKNVLLLQAAVSMNILAGLSLGLFFYLFIDKLNLIPIFPKNLTGWLAGTALVLISIGGKFLLNKFLGKLGDNVNAATSVNHLWLISLKNFGFFLLPVTVLSAFLCSPLDNIAFIAGLSLLVFMLILNYIKAFLVLIQYRISILYGILYLCTLEFLPVLIIWKLIRLTT